LAIASNYIVVNGPLPSIHAEASGIKKLIKLNKYRRFLSPHGTIDIMVIRISKTGTIGYSRPCRDCLLKMTNCKFKINQIYYSDFDGAIIMENFSSMFHSPLTKFSNGTKKKQRERKAKEKRHIKKA
jgi:hypothetical protein